MKITMIGHSTTLIETAGMRILTDPYFGLWGNPAYARIARPGKSREELKGVELVLVSHNHWDHTDRAYFRSLPADTPVVTPWPVGWLTRLKGARKVLQLGKWEQRQLGAVLITAVPASHIAVTRGFIIESDGRAIYFAGDTYYRPFMKEIGRRFALDAALLPVTTFRIPMTMGERSAVRAVEALSARTIIPIHLGIAPRSPLLRTSESAEDFRKRVQDAKLKSEVTILREGESWEC